MRSVVTSGLNKINCLRSSKWTSASMQTGKENLVKIFYTKLTMKDCSGSCTNYSKSFIETSLDATMNIEKDLNLR